MSAKPFVAVDPTRPLYRNPRPAPLDPVQIGGNTTFIDLTTVHLPPFDVPHPVADTANLFDARAAAAVNAAVGTINVDAVRFIPSGGVGGGHFVPFDPFAELLETKHFDDALDVVIPTAQSLAVIAYPDFFPGVHDDNSYRMVSEAISAANPGWCATSLSPTGRLPIGSQTAQDEFRTPSWQALKGRVRYACF